MAAKNAYQQWMRDSFDATSRAKSATASVRAVAAAIILLGAVNVAVIAATSDGSDVTGFAIGATVGSVVLGASLLYAVAAALEMLRVQTEAVLFNEDDEADEDEG